jgi:hypothetical protein
MVVNVTDWPNNEGLGEEDNTAVVLALLTVCATPAELEPLKLESPPYVAVRVVKRALVRTIEQLPVATVPVQLSAPPEALTVTFPVGVPPANVTVKFTVTS